MSYLIVHLPQLTSWHRTQLDSRHGELVIIQVDLKNPTWLPQWRYRGGELGPELTPPINLADHRFDGVPPAGVRGAGVPGAGSAS